MPDQPLGDVTAAAVAWLEPRIKDTGLTLSSDLVGWDGESPWAEIHRVPGSPPKWPHRVRHVRLQVDVYGGADSVELAERLLWELMQLNGAPRAFDGVVVTAAEVFTEVAEVPDAESEGTLRACFSVELTARPGA